MFERVLNQSRQLNKELLLCALCLTLPAAALAGLAATGDGSASLHGLVAGLALASVLVQLAIFARQKRATDMNHLNKLLATLPPELIPVDTTQPPLLQAIGILTKLRGHFLTDGSPCSPRLLIEPVDAAGVPVDQLPLDEKSAAFRSRSRQIIREPLGYTKAKIRQAARDPRAMLKWEQLLLFSEEEAEAKRAGEVAENGGGANGHVRGGSMRNDGDVHGFITANYGAARRYAEAADAETSDRRVTSPATVEFSADGDSSPTPSLRGLALPLEPSCSYDAVNALLEQSTARGTEGWDFDAIALAEATNGHSLMFFAYHAFKRTGLLEKLELERAVVLKFLQRVELGYDDNAYHNQDHACDVAQGVLWLLHTSADDVSPRGARLSGGEGDGRVSATNGSAPSTKASRTSDSALASFMEPADVLALLVGSLAHDVGHTGTSNAFHVATSSELAILYNDRSTLENHHCATLFDLCRDETCDVFKTLSVAKRRYVRDLIIAMILNTDMAVHFKNVDRMSAALSAGDLDLNKQDDKSFVLEMIIHAADIGNPCRTEAIYARWTERIMNEFYEQGDLEKQNGMPVTNFFDREAPNVPKCQMGFINFIVTPLFNVVAELIDVQPLLHNLKTNLAARQQEEREATLAAQKAAKAL